MNLNCYCIFFIIGTVLKLQLVKTKNPEQKQITKDLTRFYNNCVDRFATKVWALSAQLKSQELQNGGKWCRNFLEKFPENPKVVEVLACKPFNLNYWQLQEQNQTEQKFPEREAVPFFGNSREFYSLHYWKVS